MESANAAVISFMDATSPNTITIKNYGKVVLIRWTIAGCLDGFAVIDPKRLLEPNVVLNLMLSPRNTPTSANPQG
jgi:hypothetical protein